MDRLTKIFFVTDSAVRAIARMHKDTREPMFLLAQIRYSGNSPAKEVKAVCKEWDVWNLYFKWGERRPEVIQEYENIDGGRIERAQLISVPLFSIGSIEQVTALSHGLKMP